jgi:hypothetical protein
MKKRKLNSKNPKYYPIPKAKQVKERRDLISSINKGNNKIINVYAVFGEN